MTGGAAAARAGGGDTALWTDRTVAWYERANATSDYAERVLSAAASLLEGCRTALDVGAGFGALAIPLARRLEAVTALEPSPAMASALRRGVARNGLRNVAVLETAWGAWPVARHDVVVCAHVGPLLKRGGFLGRVGEVARRAVVIVRDAPGTDDKFFYGELYPVLLGRPYERSCADRDTVAALDALGVRPSVTPIAYDSDQPFDSLDEASDFWMTYMRLRDPAARAYLRGFLADRLERRGDLWVAPLRKHAVVIGWRVA